MGVSGWKWVNVAITNYYIVFGIKKFLIIKFVEVMMSFGVDIGENCFLYKPKFAFCYCLYQNFILPIFDGNDKI